MTFAEFGRMEVGRCIPDDIYIGCTNNVLPYFDRVCSGHRMCDVTYADLQSENTQCSSSMNMYMKTVYHCLKGTHFYEITYKKFNLINTIYLCGFTK